MTGTPEWMAEAACRGQGPGLWFAGGEADRAAAKAICAGCPVVAQCAEWGADEHFGIFGGVDHEQPRGRPASLQRWWDTLTVTHGTPAGARWHYRRGEKPCASCATPAPAALDAVLGVGAGESRAS